MRTGQRRREILRQLYETGYVEARELAEALGVDGSTIRRDLDTLARDGHLLRTHGGAKALPGAVDVPYAAKLKERTAAKEAIGAAAADMIADGDSMVLDSGSTTYALAGALRAKHDLTLVTNDIRIAHLVADYPGVRLLLTGGELLSSTYTIFGENAVEFLSELRLDWCFLGAAAIDVDTGITNTNTLEVPVKRAMLESARTTVVVADSSKFGRQALVRVADVEQVDHILTDEELGEGAARRYGTRLVRVPIVATPPPDRAYTLGEQPIPGQHPGSVSEAI